MDKKELLKIFGKNVKIERIKKDLTQEQLAENMSLGKILELAQNLNTDIHNLLSFNK